MKTITAILIASAPLLAQTDLEEEDAPDRPWSASLQILRPVGTDNPLEGSLDLSRSMSLETGRGDFTLYPGVSGAVGTTDLDTTWSVAPRLGLGWERNDWTIFVSASSEVRSWDSTEYSLSGALGFQLSPSLSLGASAGTSWLSGEWARTTLGWNTAAGQWGFGADLGLGYLWDVEVTSQGKGSRTDMQRSTMADQWQLLPSAQITRTFGAFTGAAHLDADLRAYERTKGSGGKGKMASSTAQTMWAWSATLDPWAGLGWSQGAWGADLSGGWNQPLGTGATDPGAWASLSSSFSW